MIQQQLYLESKKREIPFIFCEEDDHKNTLARAIEGNTQFIDIAKRFVTVPEIQALQQRHPRLSRPYFLAHQQEAIRAAIQRSCSTASARTVAMIGTAIQRYNAFVVSRNFKRLLSQDRTHFIPIDIKMDEISSSEVYHGREAERIAMMSQTILGKAVPQLREGGIIVVSAGMNHTERLAAHLAIAISKISRAIQLFPMVVFSGYSVDGHEGHDRAVQEGRSMDAQEIVDAYKRLRCAKLYCEEDLETRSFRSDRFTALASHIFSQYPSAGERSYLTDREQGYLSSVSRSMKALMEQSRKQ